eukprot:TRINITY_DN1099_c0_g1_i1.p1 TRINITY_DN1099_c0_g1~~TRINITY_DN1099_c0_g1_i1.p1  ORF type:complete len:333 (+),score=130.28 TRINITY_DN1099_c0_g1_i1:179-1177(+)
MVRGERKRAMKNEEGSVAAAAFWTVAWLFCNITVTLLNKAVFRTIDFKYPAFLSFVHMLFTASLSYITLNYFLPDESGAKGDLPGAEVRKSSWTSPSMLFFSSLFTINIVMGNVSLRLASVVLVQITRSIIPGITMALSILIWSRSYTLQQYSSVGIVVVGVALAMYGEFELATVTPVAIAIIFVGCVLSSSKSLTAGVFLQNQQLSPLMLAQYMSTLAVPQMLLLSFAFGELSDMWERWDLIWSTTTVTVLVVNGTLAFFLNFSNFMFTKHTSPLTVTITGNIKQVLTIMLSFFIFETPVTLVNIAGTVIAVAGAMWYSYVQYNVKHRASS